MLIPWENYDDELCVKKVILTELIKRRPGLEEMILKQLENIELPKPYTPTGCYVCEGYNYNCDNYSSSKSIGGKKK